MERNVLGKGLSALIPEGTDTRERVLNLPIDKISASSFQPRKNFSSKRLGELAESIREKGVIQPVLVRQVENGFELIAGERRLRAAQILGLQEIPAIVRQVGDADLLELSLVENIQREELNKIEEARAFQRLSKEYGLTHETIAKRVSRERATVSNTLRLLELPQKIQRFLEDNFIAMGHARCLLALGDEKKQLKLCERIINKELSVRRVENIVKQSTSPRRVLKLRRKKDVHIISMEESLQHRLGTRVNILQGKKRGKIIVDYFSSEDLNRILEILLHNS